ncbi:XTP/dITP diphosphatase [Anaerosporobacter sp.]|uniref:XTP/dITP diphosphatase n=1 Tax=Anaerosporobacter sp. TaxID=1872529 RepID=UPI00286F06F2|nr:XTP/dITP diphosphatase [Anaerosporobacter sp.]
MSKRIIFATGNEGKMKEVRMILDDLGYEILSLKDIGYDKEIIEDGKTFEENALIKAVQIAREMNEIVLADDSGLEVDYMDKQPGIYSARFLGEDTSYRVKNQYIIDQLKDAKEEERSARFVCAIACAFPNGKTLTTRATIEGYIGYEERGENGFGYDPIFMVPEFNCTTAELDLEKKNQISHRGKALEAMKKLISA